jgi:hypothetical protein
MFWKNHLPKVRSMMSALLLILALTLAPRANAQVVQYAEGGIDYVHQNGDYLPGYFSGKYRVEISNVGNTVNGEANNGLYIFRWDNQSIVPSFDASLTELNYVPLAWYMASGTSLPASNNDGGPMVMYVEFLGVNGLQLSCGVERPNPGGNVHLKFARVGDSGSTTVTTATQSAAGNIDFVHPLGDFLPGYFNGLYRITYSGSASYLSGQANNGLYTYWLNNQPFGPGYDPTLVYLNGFSGVYYQESGTSLPPPTNSSGPMSFYIRLNGVNGIQLSTHKPRFAPAGAIFVQLERVGN